MAGQMMFLSKNDESKLLSDVEMKSDEKDLKNKIKNEKIRNEKIIKQEDETENEDTPLPSILFGHDTLIPIKIDITISGARYVDTFCWKLYNSISTPDEFAWR